MEDCFNKATFYYRLCVWWACIEANVLDQQWWLVMFCWLWMAWGSCCFYRWSELDTQLSSSLWLWLGFINGEVISAGGKGQLVIEPLLVFCPSQHITYELIGCTPWILDNAHICTHICTHMHTHTHTHTYAHTHICTHMHTHTHAQASAWHIPDTW